MLTGITSLMVLLILYFLGGESIRGFAFALLVGILVGTYSSIFIASPFVLWMMSKPKTKAEKSEKTKALV
jgi:SecD/SecF fusion protein